MATTFQNVQDRINLDYLNRTDLTSETQRAIIRAINHYQYERFWFNQTATAISITSASGVITLPTDFIALDMVTLATTAGVALGPITQRSMERVVYRQAFGSSSGVPQECAVYNNTLNLYPKPDIGYTVTVRYVNTLPALSAGTDSNDWLSAAEDLIVYHAAADVLQNVIRGRADEAAVMQQMEQQALATLQRARNIRLNTNEDLSEVGPLGRQFPSKTGGGTQADGLNPQNPLAMQPPLK